MSPSLRKRTKRRFPLSALALRNAALKVLQVVAKKAGVPEDLAGKIFFPLVSGREGGSGLGLSLAQSYVHQHHGLIEFESVPGRTRFTIMLPVRSPAEAGLARH